MSLSDDLQTIDGVGPATAEKIIAVLESGDYDADSDTTAASDAIAQAIAYYEAGRPGYAGKYLYRAREVLG